MRKFLKRLWRDDRFWGGLAVIIAALGMGIIILPLMFAILEVLSAPDPFEAVDSYIFYVLGFFYFGLFVVVVGLSIAPKSIDVRSASEKLKQAAVSRFISKKEAFRLKIEEEEDESKKEKLEQEALDLHREYESLLSQNLRRNDGTFVEDWREALLVTRQRLVSEEERLLARNVANLLVGIFMVIIGIGILIYYVFFLSEVGISGGLVKFLANYGPILSIVAIIEFLAIFFLRLYAQTERGIERNKNEMTNIELRLTAGLMLFGTKEDAVKFESLSNHLAKEERNFVLGKNESSAGVSTNRLLEILSKVVKGGVS